MHESVVSETVRFFFGASEISRRKADRKSIVVCRVESTTNHFWGPTAGENGAERITADVSPAKVKAAAVDSRERRPLRTTAAVAVRYRSIDEAAAVRYRSIDEAVAQRVAAALGDSISTTKDDRGTSSSAPFSF